MIMKIKKWKNPKLKGRFDYEPRTVRVYCPNCGFGKDKTVESPTFQMVEYPERMLCPKCRNPTSTYEKLEIAEA